VSFTESSVTSVHSRVSGPASTLSPCAQETSWSPTRSVARPPSTPPNARVVFRRSALAPSPERVTEHDVPEQETESEVTLQAASGASSSPGSSWVATTPLSANSLDPVRVASSEDRPSSDSQSPTQHRYAEVQSRRNAGMPITSAIRLIAACPRPPRPQ